MWIDGYADNGDHEYKEQKVRLLEFKMGNHIFYSDKFDLNTDRYDALFNVVGEKALKQKDDTDNGTLTNNVENINSNCNGLKKLDFDNGDNCVNKINSWVSSMTNDQIKNIVNNSDFRNPNLMAIMVNAIYLKACWDDRFEKENNYYQQKFYSNVCINHNLYV